MTNQAMMISKVKNIYIMLLNAISKENISLVDHYLDDELTKNINQYIENNKQNNTKQVFRQQNISNLIILEENDEFIRIQATIRHITYFVNRKNNKYVERDNDSRITRTIYLKFKKNNLTHRSIIHCPDCGATININASSICTYCGMAVDERFSHFVLCDISF